MLGRIKLGLKYVVSCFFPPSGHPDGFHPFRQRPHAAPLPPSGVPPASRSQLTHLRVGGSCGGILGIDRIHDQKWFGPSSPLMVRIISHFYITTCHDDQRKRLVDGAHAPLGCPPSHVAAPGVPIAPTASDAAPTWRHAADAAAAGVVAAAAGPGVCPPHPIESPEYGPHLQYTNYPKEKRCLPV